MIDTSQLDRLRAELRRPGRSQSGLARALGLHPSAVNKMLSGKREIKARELAQIEQYLRETNASLDEIITRSETVLPGVPTTAELAFPTSTHSHFSRISLVRDTERFNALLESLLAAGFSGNIQDVASASLRLLLPEIKALILGRFVNLNEADAHYLLHMSKSLDDQILLRALAKTFGILNAAELEKLEFLQEAVKLMIDQRTHPEDPRVLWALTSYAPAKGNDSGEEVAPRVVAQTLKLATIIQDASRRQLERVSKEIRETHARRKAKVAK